MKRVSALLVFFFLANITSVVYSDNIIDNSDHQYNQQLEFQEKLHSGNDNNVNLYDNIKVDRKYELPQDENSFYISHIELIDDTGRFRWLQKILNKYDKQNDDNIVMKLSPDGMLIITVTAPTLAEPNTIVNIHGLEGTIKHLPYYTEQTVKFVEQV